MTKFREFTIEIVVIGLTALAGIIGLSLSLAEAYLIWSLGILIAVSIFALKRELISRYDDRIEIYRLVDEMSDDELREKGYALIDECKHKLQELAKGTFTGGVTEVFEQAIKRIKKARIKVQATHLATTQERLYAWKDVPVVVNYYEENKMAIGRKVKVERIFIVDKALILDLDSDKVKDEKALGILKEQVKDKIDVTIVWEQDLPSFDLLDDFIIFDRSVVHVEKTGISTAYKGLTVTKAPQDIRFYELKFDTLKSYGQTIDKVSV